MEAVRWQGVGTVGREAIRARFVGDAERQESSKSRHYKLHVTAMPASFAFRYQEQGRPVRSPRSEQALGHMTLLIRGGWPHAI